MSNVTIGTLGAIEQPSSYGFTQGKGSFSKRTWKITDSAVVSTLISQLASAGYSYEVTNGQFITVEARAEADPSSGTNETVPLADIWERSSNAVEKELLSSNHPAIRAIPPDKILVIKDYLANIQSPTAGGAPALTQSTQVAVWQLLLSGVKSRVEFQPIIRHTYITANNYTVKWADTNMGKIVSAAQMTSLEGCPSTVLFNLPTETPSTPAAGNFTYIAGFFKKPANVLQIAGGQWQISQEYDFGFWADVLYDAAT